MGAIGDGRYRPVDFPLAVDGRDARRPVLLFMNALGDHLLNLPAIRALSSLFSGRLRLVCLPGARATFFPYLGFAQVLEPQATGEDLDYYQYCFDAHDIATILGWTDLFLCLNPVPGKSSTDLLRLLNPRSSIGFDQDFATHIRVDFQKHNADLAFSVARALDPSLDIESFASPPDLSRESAERAETIIGKLPMDHSALVVHADTKPEKTWPAARLRILIERLLELHPKLVVFDVGLTSVLDGVRFCERVLPCGPLDLPTAMGLVGRANLFLGMDSCFLHAADLFRVPGVGLFGPTSAQEFGFRFASHRHVVADTSMATVGIDEVLSAVESLNRELGCFSGRQTAAFRPHVQGRRRDVIGGV